MSKFLSLYGTLIHFGSMNRNFILLILFASVPELLFEIDDDDKVAFFLSFLEMNFSISSMKVTYLKLVLTFCGMLEN